VEFKLAVIFQRKNPKSEQTFDRKRKWIENVRSTFNRI